MERLTRYDIYIKFSEERDEWDLILLESDEIIDSASTLVALINAHNCLK